MPKTIARAAKAAEPNIRNLKNLQPKQRGNLGEIAFLHRAVSLGYVCSQPFGDNARYDWIVGGASRRLKRVQVKTVWGINPCLNLYSANCCRANGQAYKVSELDLLAVYIAPEDIWYIIPAPFFCGHFRLYFRPWPTAKDWWRKYREAWWRLGKPSNILHSAGPLPLPTEP